MTDQDRNGPAFAEMSRRDVLRWAAAAGLAVPFGGALAACGSNDESGGGGGDPLKTSRDGLVSYFTLDNIYYKSYDDGVQAAMKALNMRYHRAVSDYDESKQRAAMENAASLGIDGVSTIPNSESIAPQMVRLCEQNGIDICTMWNSAPWLTPLDVGDHWVTFGVVNSVNAFKENARVFFKKLGGKGKVIQLDGIRGASVNTERLDGVDRARKEFPEIDIVATRPGSWSRDKARPVIDDLLVAYPDVDGVLCHNDDMAVAVVASLRQKGSKALVAGGDAVPEALEYIKRGEMHCTLATHASWLGGQLTVRQFDALNGWKPTPAERMIHWGAFVIDTPKAAAEYQKVIYDGPPPYDFAKMSRVLNPKDWDPGNLIVPLDPAKYWAFREKEKPDGYDLPKEYQGSTWQDDFDKTSALYKEHFKSDKLEKCRSLCQDGGTIV